MGVLYGVDLSNWQAGISLAGIAGEGFEFVFCKVSQGTGYRSPDWPRQRDEARAAGLVLAGYHYVDESDPAAQAANCAAALGDLSIPVALDHEKGGGGVDNFRRVLAAFRAAGIRVALSYVPRWYWQEIGQPDISDLPPLWSSRYPSTQQAPASVLYQTIEQVGGSLSKYWQGYGGNHVAVLQFASTALVQGRPIDANAFYGSRDDLLALLGSGAPPAPPAPDNPPAPTSSEEDDMPSAQEIADAILDTPIPRMGDNLPTDLVGGTTSLRNETAWLTNSAINLGWLAPGAGALVAQQVASLAAAGSSTPDEVRALRAQVDRLTGRLDTFDGGAGALPPAVDPVTSADIRSALTSAPFRVQFNENEGIPA